MVRRHACAGCGPLSHPDEFCLFRYHLAGDAVPLAGGSGRMARSSGRDRHELRGFLS